MSTSRRTLVVAALVCVALVVLPGVALAHASFDVRQLPAGATQDLTLRVPLEREADNDLVEVLVPGGFTVAACEGADGWDCRQDVTADGDTVVTLTRADDDAGTTERFSLTLTAPDTEGVYPFPTIQTYADGVEASWIGEPGSDQPAPRIQVGDESSEVELAGDATPHTDLADDVDEPTGDPGAEPATDDTVADEPEAEATEDTDDVTDADSAPDGAAVSDTTDDGGLPVVALVVAGVVALGGMALAVARRRG